MKNEPLYTKNKVSKETNPTRMGYYCTDLGILWFYDAPSFKDDNWFRHSDLTGERKNPRYWWKDTGLTIEKIKEEAIKEYEERLAEDGKYNSRRG